MQCERPRTLADGLRGRMGDLTWPIVRDFVDDVITVTEEQIIDAMQLCFERMKVRYCSSDLRTGPHLRSLQACSSYVPRVSTSGVSALSQHRDVSVMLLRNSGLPDEPGLTASAASPEHECEFYWLQRWARVATCSCIRIHR